MIRRLADRLTYANVVATLALFIALGGVSWAAVTLPRNSVGTKQLRAGAVRSTDVKDRSLQLRDLGPRARASLRGQAGPAGPAGPAGAAAAKHFASVSAAGGLLRGNATSGGNAGATGTYVIGFSDRVSACAFTATVGTTDAAALPGARATVREVDGRVGVQTFDANGAPADLPFHLVVAC